MIQLTRLNHQAIALNADLIKWVESSPDTVITLINGEKLVVSESCDAVISAVLDLRRRSCDGSRLCVSVASSDEES